MTTPANRLSGRKTINNFVAALSHPWSLLFIIIVTITLSLHSSIGILDIDEHSLASNIFAVAGTMVALILPAAELAHNSFTKFKAEFVDSVIRGSDDLAALGISKDRQALVLGSQASELRNRLKPAWRASSFVFVSFLLAIVAMIIPPIHVPLGDAFSWSIDAAILASSLGFLIAGSCWFMPTALSFFNMDSLDSTEQDIRERLGSSPIPITQPPES